MGRRGVARGRWLIGILALLVASFVGCASLPELGSIEELGAGAPPAPRVVGSSGPLSAEQSRAIIDRLKRQAGNPDILARHLAIEEAVSASPLTTGNQVRLLNDGPDTYRAMFREIENARDSVNLESYIIDDDQIGYLLADLLIRKQSEGVQVNLIYDSAGSIGTPRAFFERLEKAGVAVVEFNPVNPLAARGKWLINHRDHRKILVVDGQVAFTGGINISSVYASSTPGRHPRIVRKSTDTWRDIQLEVRGPAVAQFQKLFVETWHKQRGRALAPRNYFPTIQASGHHIVRVIGGYADEADNLIYITLLSAMGSGERTIHIANAYFAPDPQTIRVLSDAARRGVDVKLLLPGHSDFWAIFHAGRSHYSELLAAGVKIYERHDTMLHAKTAVIDGVWSTVGSSNLDWRSFLHNDEANAVVLGTEFGDQMEATFQRDLAKAVPVERGQWERRSMTLRLKEFAARLWEYWL